MGGGGTSSSTDLSYGNQNAASQGAYSGDILGGLAGAGATIYAAERANQTNKEIAKRQMQFQADMSNTAHQRQVADMRMAGLNPMLSAMQGGASTPQGAGFAAENPAQQLSSTASEMMERMRQKAVDKSNMSVDRHAERKMNSEVSLNKTSEHTQEALRELYKTQADLNTQSAKNHKNQGVRIEQEANLYRDNGRWLVPAEKAIEVGGNVVSGLSSAAGVGAAVKKIGLPNSYNPKTTGTFNKRTGEIYD